MEYYNYLKDFEEETENSRKSLYFNYQQEGANKTEILSKFCPSTLKIDLDKDIHIANFNFTSTYSELFIHIYQTIFYLKRLNDFNIEYNKDEKFELVRQYLKNQNEDNYNKTIIPLIVNTKTLLIDMCESCNYLKVLLDKIKFYNKNYIKSNYFEKYMDNLKFNDNDNLLIKKMSDFFEEFKKNHHQYKSKNL